MAAGGALRAAVAVERNDALGFTGRGARGVVGRAAGEVPGPVLFRRQVGAPGRAAAAAVVDGAAHLTARRRVLGAHERVVAYRSGHLHRRQRRHAAVQQGALHVGERAVAPGHLDDGDAMRRDLLVALGGRTWARRLATDVQVVLAQRFVVDHQQTTSIAGGIGRRPAGSQAVVLHAVMVIAGTVVEVGVAAVVGVGRGRAGQRVAQGEQYLDVVAGSHCHCVRDILVDGREAQALQCAGRRCVIVVAAAGAQAQAAQDRSGRRAHAATQNAATRQACIEHTHECRIAGGVQVVVVMVIARAQAQVGRSLHHGPYGKRGLADGDDALSG